MIIVSVLIAVLALGLIAAGAGVRVVQQFERGVVLRFGQVLPETGGAGLTLITPVMDRLHKVNMQIITMPIPAQDGITRDNVTVRVDAVPYYRVIDSPALGWGVHIDRVEIKDVALPESMKRSMSRQAEAERERRSRVITADGELQASTKLAQAAEIMTAHPAALQLRLLQTVVEVAAEKNSTLVLPFPVELLRFLERATPAMTTTATPTAAPPQSATDGPPLNGLATGRLPGVDSGVPAADDGRSAAGSTASTQTWVASAAAGR